MMAQHSTLVQYSMALSYRFHIRRIRTLHEADFGPQKPSFVRLALRLRADLRVGYCGAASAQPEPSLLCRMAPDLGVLSALARHSNRPARGRADRQKAHRDYFVHLLWPRGWRPSGLPACSRARTGSRRPDGG